MLVVKTGLKEFKGKGIGLIAKELIKKGTVVCAPNPIMEIKADKKQIPKEARDFYETYAVEYEKGKLVLHIDNERFINHSSKPNIKSLGNDKGDIAIRDIKPGEEITIDYSTIDIDGLNFKEL